MQRSSPIGFFMRGSLFALLLAMFLGILAWMAPPVTPVDYTAAMMAKHARARSIGSPKVLLAGGSNVAFGVDSETLERHLCRPVVNLGLHAGLGFRFMTNELIDLMGPKDLVIVALEESNFTDPIKDHEVIYQTVDRYPASLKYVPWWDRPRIVAGIVVLRLQSAWKKWTGKWTFTEEHPLYRASGFNAHGDMVAHLSLTRPDSLQTEGLDPTSSALSERFADLADELARTARKKGVQVVYTWPGRAASGYDPVRSQKIKEGLHAQGLLVVGEPGQFVFTDSLFHDTRFHLRAEGRDMRTDSLITALCRDLPDHCCMQP